MSGSKPSPDSRSTIVWNKHSRWFKDTISIMWKCCTFSIQFTDYQSHMTLHWLCWQKAHAFINITLNLSDTLLLDKWKETVSGSMQISHGDAFGDSLGFMTRPQHHHAKICSTCIPLWWYSAQMLLLFGHLLLHLRNRRICDLPGGIRQWHQQG